MLCNIRNLWWLHYYVYRYISLYTNHLQEYNNLWKYNIPTPIRSEGGICMIQLLNASYDWSPYFTVKNLTELQCHNEYIVVNERINIWTVISKVLKTKVVVNALVTLKFIIHFLFRIQCGFFRGRLESWRFRMCAFDLNQVGLN